MQSLSLFFDSLLGLNLRRAYTYGLCYHMNSFVFLFYVDCQSKKWTYLFKKLVVLKDAIDFYSYFMYRSNRSFNFPPPPGNPPGISLFGKLLFKFPSPSQNAIQIPHNRVHSSDQMPPPRGHFRGT